MWRTHRRQGDRRQHGRTALARVPGRARCPQAVVEEMLLTYWNTQQLGRKIDLLLNSRLPADAWRDFESESKHRFVSTYTKLGGKAPVRRLTRQSPGSAWPWATP